MLANIRDVGRSQLRSWCPSNRNKDIAACKTPSTLSTRRLDNLSFIVFWFDSGVKGPREGAVGEILFQHSSYRSAWPRRDRCRCNAESNPSFWPLINRFLLFAESYLQAGNLKLD